MDEHEQRVDQAIAEYLTQAAAGSPPPREQFLARYPDLAESLAAFLNDHAKMDQALQAAAPIDPAFAPTLAPGESKPADPTLGRIRYFGDYELIAEIARGGMGVVFKARQVSLNREVALKMILAGELASPADVQRFRTEAEAAANLDHPHILPIFEVGSHDGQHYFSMKLIDGGNLADRLSELRRQPRRAVALLARCARAVQFAHERGVLHRDLKPANILLDRDGQPYISDFGLARKVEGDSKLTQTGAIVGSPSYMPPEQARAEKQLTTAADTYALGAILYEVLTGQPPFRGPTIMDTVMQVLEKEPTPPRAIDPAVDADLATIALKCLEKEPTRRYASAGELADDLERWLHGEPIRARPTTTLERVRKWGKRNPMLAASLAGLLALLIWGLVLLSSLLYQTQLREQEASAAATAARAAAEREGELRRNADKARDEAQDHARRADAERRAAERLLYFNRVALAQQYWRGDGLEQARTLLQACSPELHGWEWGYLTRLLQPELLRLPGNGQFTRHLAFSRDGTRLAAFAETGDSGVRIWDLSTKKPVCEIQLSTTNRSFSAGDLSGDGKTVALGDRQGRISLWDATSGKLLKDLKPLPGEVKYLRFSPDAALLLIQGPNRPELREVATDVPRPLPAEATEVFQFSPDGRWLLGRRRNPQLFVPNSLQQNQMMIWDAATMAQGHVLGFAQAWDFSTDGKRLVISGSDMVKPPFLKVLEVGTWAEKFGIEVASVGDVGLSPDGRWIAQAERMNRPLHVYDAATGRRLRTLRGHEGYINALQFHPDGRLFTCSWDNTIRAWDPSQDQEYELATGQPLPVVSDAAVQPMGNLVACVGGDNMGSGPLRLLGGAPELQVVLWDPLARRAVHKLARHKEGARRVAFSADGVYVLGGGRDGLAAVWRVADGQLLGAMKHPGWIEGVALSPDGKLAASSHEPSEQTAARFNRGPYREVPGEVRVWNAQTGELVHTLTGHKSLVTRIAFSPDGDMLVSLSYGQLRFWNVATGRLTRELAAPSLTGTSVAFSPDGKVLVLAGRRGLQWVQTATGQVLGTPVGGDDISPVISFSPDGQRLMASYGDQIKVFDVLTRQEIITLPSPTKDRIVALGFTPEGWLRAVLSTGQMVTWRTPKLSIQNTKHQAQPVQRPNSRKPNIGSPSTPPLMYSHHHDVGLAHSTP